VYFRKEGRALGEVTKYLVYNMRKRQEGGDRAKEYGCGVTFTPSTPSTRRRHRRDSPARVSAGILIVRRASPVYRIPVSRH